MQFYKIGISQSDSSVIIGGAQDNGTSLRTSVGENKWRVVWGGDGMDCAIDPINSNNIMVSSQNGNAGRSTDGGKSFRSSITTSTTGESGQWVTPIIYVPGQDVTQGRSICLIDVCAVNIYIAEHLIVSN